MTTNKDRKEYMKEYMKQYRAKNKEKLNLQRRIRRQAKALKKKAKKLVTKNAEIEEQIRTGNLNYELQEGEMTYTEYKEFWARFDRKPSFDDYIREINENRRQKQIHQHDVYATKEWQILANVPVIRATQKECIRFRAMYLAKVSFDSLVIDSHSNCKACLYWRYKNKKVLPLRPSEVHGVDLWNQNEITVKQTSDQDIIREEMAKLYGARHRTE